MTKKISMIVINMPDGSVWEMSALPIATARAAYYAEIDSRRGDGEYDETYEAEMELALTDASELLDYLGNNYDWKDLLRLGLKQTKAPKGTDYNEMFRSAGVTKRTK